MNIEIRKAKQEDMHQVLNLIQELAIFEKEPDAVIITANDLIKDGFSENPLFYCFVAEINKEVIGIALYYYRYSTWKGKTIHLEDLIVKKEFRGIGAGELLYKKVLEQGLLENVQRMEWAVLDWNTYAVEFYKNSGAKILEDWRVVHIFPEEIKKYIYKDESI